ncbi:hypothetical protein L3X38_003807 [Prunus dulcis]|uniref:Uncharacterized protein n=1 Tax=Prunus dulcis TaxID=3755 RepID=A0AAD4ZMT5_PRUDU|nr:hypothetical protein L3X38_003807 [Prunus dulcis]
MTTIQRLKHIEPENRTIGQIRSGLKHYPNQDPRNPMPREDQGIILGLKMVPTILPRSRDTRRQSLVLQSDNASPENLQISAQDSYSRCNTLFGTTFVLGPPQNLVGSGRNGDSKTGQTLLENRVAYATKWSIPSQP